MSHFAKIDANGIVVAVIVAEQDYIDRRPDAGSWVQTSYNTFGGINSRGTPAIRKNFAGVGYTYDQSRDAFIAPKPDPAATLDEATCLWVMPPTDVPPVVGGA
ncbi:MAG: hypothetical protein GC182_08860 [Rhodopseudomonas sp.]|nr:hypothetical protein [Rhodopseudomonas sp.]